MRSPGWAVLRQDGLAFGDRSDDGDVGKDSGRRLRDIAACEGDSGLLGGIQEAIEELVDPALGEIGGHGEGKKCGEGFAAHGRDVGESAGEAAVADRVGGMPLAAEVDTFQREIGGDQGLEAGEGGEYGAVVANGMQDAGGGVAALGWAGGLAGMSDAFDETGFGNRHDVTDYSQSSGGEKGGDAE